MISDFRSAPDGSKIETDLCIIGAGAAGIAIAHSLIATSLRVALVEAGGLKFDPDTQALYDGDVTGDPWGVELTRTRLRWFGGSTNEWGKGCIPLDHIDFVERSWVPSSGWPIQRQELTKYYEKARAFCAIPTFRFDDRELLHRVRPRLPVFDPKMLTHCYAMLSFPGGFGKAYARSLKRAANIEVILHANLVELVPQESGRSVVRASIRTVDGRSGTIRARWYVLACGGIENARLLLLSDSVARSGLGNEHDVVGRYFMDHPNIHFGRLRPETGMALAAPYIKRLRRRLPIWPVIRLSEELQKQDELLNGRFQFVLREEGEEPEGMQALRILKRGVRQGLLSWDMGRWAYRAAIDWRGVLPAVSRHIRGFPTSAAPRIDIEGFFEQAPNPVSRIGLSHRRDALGLRKVRLDWRLTDLDYYTYRAVSRHFVRELDGYFPRAIQLAEWLAAGQQKHASPRGTAHHMGTTRMSNNPRLGVVDRNCRVHGVDNLYVAGSSVFPTSGWAFPTFTIIALALRLSEHIIQESRGKVPGHRTVCGEGGRAPARTASGCLPVS